MNDDTKNILSRAGTALCAWLTSKTGWPANIVKVLVGFILGGLAGVLTASGMTSCNVTYTSTLTEKGETVTYKHEFAPVSEVVGGAAALLNSNPNPAQ